jgi:hypothetical protein
MDKQNRLTKWEEWEIGATYQWVKGSLVLDNYRCTEVNRKEGFVRLATGRSIESVRQFNWQKRFRRQVLPKTLRSPTGARKVNSDNERL